MAVYLTATARLDRPILDLTKDIYSKILARLPTGNDYIFLVGQLKLGPALPTLTRRVRDIRVLHNRPFHTLGNPKVVQVHVCGELRSNDDTAIVHRPYDCLQSCTALREREGTHIDTIESENVKHNVCKASRRVTDI
jgi:hypothetical protein